MKKTNTKQRQTMLVGWNLSPEVDIDHGPNLHIGTDIDPDANI